jgi:hypothetical protein
MIEYGRSLGLCFSDAAHAWNRDNGMFTPGNHRAGKPAPGATPRPREARPEIDEALFEPQNLSGEGVSIREHQFCV